MAAPPRPAGCRAAGTSAGRRGVSALTWRRWYVLSRRWRGVARPAVANGQASGASGRHPGRRVDGIWFTVHPDPGRCFIYRPDPGSPGPSDVKCACRIDPTDWAAEVGTLCGPSGGPITEDPPAQACVTRRTSPFRSVFVGGRLNFETLKSPVPSLITRVNSGMSCCRSTCVRAAGRRPALDVEVVRWTSRHHFRARS